jgi:hypothetical protein
MKLFAAINIMSIFLASSIEVQALRGSTKRNASDSMDNHRGLLETSFYSSKLRNGLDSTLCLSYNFNTGKLSVQPCQDGSGFPEAQQGWDLFESYGEPHLHPESDVCLKSTGDGSSKYAALTMTGNMQTCSPIQTTAEGKIYVEHDDGTKMYLGISGSCHTSHVEGNKVELQRFDFPTDRTCGKAQLWYLE